MADRFPYGFRIVSRSRYLSIDDGCSWCLEIDEIFSEVFFNGNDDSVSQKTRGKHGITQRVGWLAYFETPGSS